MPLQCVVVPVFNHGFIQTIPRILHLIIQGIRIVLMNNHTTIVEVGPPSSAIPLDLRELFGRHQDERYPTNLVQG
jgi:hypothetical protein